ncbi:MAG: P-loop containing nucleoside triphosphate hydrolase protein, partial [Piptocephalis tieghemiana]
ILQAVLQFILPRLMERKRAHRNSKSRRGKKPYILLVSGPQGSGKSTLVRELRADLKTRGLGVAIMSLDDLYLTYEEQKRLTQGTKNPLWRGRGLPGTHDVELGRRVMQALVEGRTVRLPRFDKAANHGMGDRSAEGVLVGQSPVDVVLFEGWCLGYRSMQEGELEEAWTRESSSLPSSLQGQVSLKDVQEVNEQLRQGIEPWLERADGVVEIRTKEISTIYNWREGAEAQLRTVSGQGLSVEEVRRMVDRFAVMYQLWWPWMRT